jgi:hypothetical protein
VNGGSRYPPRLPVPGVFTEAIPHDRLKSPPPIIRRQLVHHEQVLANLHERLAVLGGEAVPEFGWLGRLDRLGERGLDLLPELRQQ